MYKTSLKVWLHLTAIMFLLSFQSYTCDHIKHIRYLLRLIVIYPRCCSLLIFFLSLVVYYRFLHSITKSRYTLKPPLIVLIATATRCLQLYDPLTAINITLYHSFQSSFFFSFIIKHVQLNY